MKVRHPEKVNKPVNPIKRKPNWIKSKIINSKEFFITKSLINKSKLVINVKLAIAPNILYLNIINTTTRIKPINNESIPALIES